MTFVGFITRRVLKSVANSIIDNVVEDKDQARALKRNTGLVISGIGIGLSILTFDPAGVADAGLDIAGTAGDVLDHVGTASDLLDHAGTAGDIVGTTSDISDHVGTVSDMADTTSPWADYASTAHTSTDIRFGERMHSMALANHYDIFDGSLEDMSSGLQELINQNKSLLGHLQESVHGSLDQVKEALGEAERILEPGRFRNATKAFIRFRGNS